MAMSEPVLRFERSFVTGDVVGHQLGRINLGVAKLGATVRLVLFPDGVHLFVPDGAKKFVHPMDENVIVPVGVPDAAK